MEIGNLVQVLELDGFTNQGSFPEFTLSSLYFEVNSLYLKQDINGLFQLMESIQKMNKDKDPNISSLYYIAKVNLELLERNISQDTVNELNNLLLNGTSFEAEIYFKLAQILEFSHEYWMSLNYYSKAQYLFEKLGAKQRSLESEICGLDVQLQESMYVKRNEVLKAYDSLEADVKAFPNLQARILLKKIHINLIADNFNQAMYHIHLIKNLVVTDIGIEPQISAIEFYYYFLIGEYKMAKERLAHMFQTPHNKDAIDTIMSLSYENVSVENILLSSGLLPQIYELASYHSKLTREESQIINIFRKNGELSLEQLIDLYGKKNHKPHVIEQRVKNLISRVNLKKPGLIKFNLDLYKLSDNILSFEYYWATKKQVIT